MRIKYVILFCLLSATLMVSCAQTLPYGEGVNLVVSPHKLNVHSGSEHTLFVKVLDKQGGPIFGMKVEAKSTSPTVATVTPEAVTDVAGNVTFTVNGISPGTTHITISTMGYKATAEVVFLEH
ncbi:MAG: hypothetical protein HW390_3101 [Candidatus Brocadiaceae bacterium]|nr:hypothetical protein [Candidatus Brocadiaceae bacterium]